MRYEHLLAELYRRPWAILPEKFSAIAHLVRMRAAGEKFTEEQVRAKIAPEASAGNRPGSATYGAIAVIPVYGVISRRMNLMTQISGGTSIDKLTAQLRGAVADSSIKAIVLDVDSPGGTVDGVPELAEEIYIARAQKKLVAIANTMAASAAYWLASAASEVSVTPSGCVGSIGVFTEHEDVSKMLESAGVKVSMISAGKYKTDGNPYEPLSDSAREELQGQVDAFYEMFVKAVAKGRGSSLARVKGGFGQGRVVLASASAEEGMVDRVETFDQLIARLGGSNVSSRRMASAGPMEEPGDANPDPQECHCDCTNCAAGDCHGCYYAPCADVVCLAAGCQANAKKASAMASLSLRERELRTHSSTILQPCP